MRGTLTGMTIKAGSFARYIRCVSALTLVLLVVMGTTADSVAASLTVRIDISKQNMRVSRDRKTLYVWPVSTARSGYRTPVGVFRPVRLERMWYSTKYHNSPMPHSVFFYYGYAIHGTNDLRHLGRPASHGCVRLHPNHARKLFSLIKRIGRSRTTIIVQR